MVSPDVYCPYFVRRTLKQLLGLICCILVLAKSVNGQVVKGLKSEYYPLEEAAKPVDLFISTKSTYLITENGIHKKERKTFLKKYTSSSPITCALEDDTVLWVGTQKGLLRVNKKTFSSKSVSLPIEENQPLITTLLRDYAGTIWVGAEAYGVFKYTAHQFEKVLGAFPVNTGAVTKDSSVWIGTNTGLYKAKDKEWVRYNEEGVTNFEIPDNIVENLQVDNHNNLWVVMSEGVTVFEAKHHYSTSDEHLPVVKFIGKPNNAIYSVIYVNQQGYVFATGMGLLYLPTSHSGHLSNLEQSQTTDIVTDKQILVPVQMPGRGNGALDSSYPLLLKSDKRNNAWIINKRGIRVITNKKFVRLLQQYK